MGKITLILALVLGALPVFWPAVFCAEGVPPILGYHITLEGPTVRETIDTCWPLLWGWPYPEKGFKQYLIPDLDGYEYTLMVETTPRSAEWQKYHWVGVNIGWWPPGDTIFRGDYADVPLTDLNYNFVYVPEPDYVREEEVDVYGYIDVYVYHGNVDGGGSGHTYCVSLLPILNPSSLVYIKNATPDPRIGLCKIKTNGIRATWVGAVASTSWYEYDIYQLPPELQH